MQRVVAVVALCIVVCGLPAPSAAVWNDPDWDFTRHLSTKTLYYPLQFDANRTAPPAGCQELYVNFLARSVQNLSGRFFLFPLHFRAFSFLRSPVSPILLFMFDVRHGSRAPTSDDIDNLSKLQAILDAERAKILHLNSTMFGWMLKWKNPFPLALAGELDEVGEIEHYHIARRVLADYPDAFASPYVSIAYPIRTTEVPRASRSGNAFGYGLFENKGELGTCQFKPFYQYSVNKTRDLELRFFKVCPKFQSRVLANTTTYSEKNKVLEAYTPQIATRLSKVLNWTVSDKTITIMFRACAFEYALNKTRDQWCSIFTKEEFLIYEYSDDLSFFYESGYGGEGLGYRIACPLLKDMVNKFDAKINFDPDYQIERAHLRFAHAETLVPFVTMMGLYNDSYQWKADSPWDRISQRQWRTSIISPFAGNFMLILYNCSAATDGGAQYRVKMLHNEKEFSLGPRCNNQMYCPYDDFKRVYLTEPLSCNFDALCDVEKVKPDVALSPDPVIITVVVGVIFAVVGIIAGYAVAGL
jgi:multiple inositol-polyphosphate phosphatase / 2,3-bisphosphoglycerate 3-phosphatase